MITFKHRGNFKSTEKYLKRLRKYDPTRVFKRYGQMGVDALASATPVESGTTSKSWGYKIIDNKDYCGIAWTNSNVVDGVQVAIVLQYGHATKTGGFVQGVDYINPAIRPVFDEIADAIWKEVTNL